MRADIATCIRRRASWIAGVLTSVTLTCGVLAATRTTDAVTLDPANTGLADPVALERAYAQFAATAPPANVVFIPVGNLRGISTEAVNAGGQVVVNLASGQVDSAISLLPLDESFDLWLVDNADGPGRTTLADPGDALLKIGTYAVTGGRHRLSIAVGSPAFATFFPDRAFVVRTGQSPMDAFVLTGSSTLFTRIRQRVVPFGDENQRARLVGRGRQIFLNETFDGNGRSCGTCHREDNNFTIDPERIAALPPDDALFVAQNNPALSSLENADLLRRFGLILVNADGFDPSRGFVFRSTQNVQALANSSRPQNPSFGIDFSTNGRNPNPPERLGWGNDAPPLREFALVAIAQHATRTMGRRAGLDFRVPTDEELDALAAYQLSLGRQEDFTLSTLELKSELATTGQALFLDTGDLFEPTPPHKNCMACHFNGGGTAGVSFNPATPGFPHLDGSPRGFNIASATHVADIPAALALNLPPDGGFGQVPTIFGSFGNTDDLPPPFGHFEIEEFNSPPLVESADTAPFFHNHAAADLESAVAFYGTPAFTSSVQATVIPVAISGSSTDPEVQAIAAFLRMLNALENIRSSINAAERARAMTQVHDMHDLARLSLSEVDDAIDVLSSGALATHDDSVVGSARAELSAAKAALGAVRHVPARAAVEDLLRVAVQQLRKARASLATPTTLPETYRN